MPETSSSLRSQLLIAMPTLHDTYFSRSVTLICEHSLQDGAMGVIINQPASIDITELLAQMSLDDGKSMADNQSTPIFAGGPVNNNHGFILYNSSMEHESDLQILPDLYLTSSIEMLNKIASGKGPENCLIVLGYAGWSPGQLEDELSANSWLTTEYQHHLVFETPADQQWLAAGAKLGVDLNLLSSEPGHA